ncbi:MAG: hypothetical protein A2Y12_09210 [Planctomycetes bacterium GWF2_42_9]|nr:MAG: hypothetical protein A2Y12_09210 [Planctomycetes bacterium GWF2_42_9]
MIIGIIGAENSHATAIAKAINVEGKVKGFTVGYIWGETAEFAQKAAELGKIPNVVSDPSKMLGKVDAIVVDHRHGQYHLKAALPFVKQGSPVFIDKPLCCRAKDGAEFLKIAHNFKAPVTSFGVVPLQRSFINFMRKLEKIGNIYSGAVYGPCDIKSPYGGVFFYGIHQVEMALHAFGYDVEKVLVVKNDKNAIGQLFYKNGKTIVLNLIESGCSGFSITAAGDKGNIHEVISFDKEMFLPGIKKFTAMFKSKVEPLSYQQILKPVQVLEAMEKSIKSGKSEKVQRIK